jgi:hypothetical protein
MRSLASRFSDWVVVHPVRWGVASGVVLVLLGVALDLAPIVVIAAGATIGGLNILHAKRRGYCPLPADPGAHPARAGCSSRQPEPDDLAVVGDGTGTPVRSDGVDDGQSATAHRIGFGGSRGR